MRQRLLKALNRKYPDKIPHYLIMNHPAFISDVTGTDYYQRPLDSSLKFHQTYEVEIGGPVALSKKPIKKESLETKWHLKSPRILQSGTKDDIFAEVKRVADVAKEIPGFMLSCTNDIQQTVPIGNVYHYFAAVEKYRIREV